MNDEHNSVIALFMQKLGISRQMADAFFLAGMTTLEEIAYVPLSELLEIQGFEKASVLRAREQACEILAPPL